MGEDKVGADVAAVLEAAPVDEDGIFVIVQRVRLVETHNDEAAAPS